MATREIEEAIIEDATDEWDGQREAVEAIEWRSSHRRVLEQRTQVRMVYQHTLVLECGHTEHRTGGRAGATISRAKCSSCAPTPPVVEEAQPKGWLERLLPGRRS
jgi:hypothetical protein